MQATVKWEFFDKDNKRISLQATVDILIEEGYTIDSIVPITSYHKKESTVSQVSEAIIVVSRE